MLFHLELRGVDDVARPAARRKEQYVNPLQIACPDETRGDRVGSADHPAQAIIVDRKVQIICPLAPLYLNESNGPPAPHDQVNLAARSLDSPGKDAPALEPEVPGCQCFAAPALLLAVLPVFHLSSIARA